MKTGLTISLLMGSLVLAPSYAKTYSTAAPAGSGCKNYDVSPVINAIDKNHDGKLTHTEWIAAGAPETSFEGIDKDKKGYITPEEFEATTPPPGIDTNHDCKITVAKMNAMAPH